MMLTYRQGLRQKIYGTSAGDLVSNETVKRRTGREGLWRGVIDERLEPTFLSIAVTWSLVQIMRLPKHEDAEHSEKTSSTA